MHGPCGVGSFVEETGSQLPKNIWMTTRSGSASASFVRPRFRPPRRCIAPGTMASHWIHTESVPGLLGLILSIVAWWDPSSPTLHRYESVEPHMGTLVRITVTLRTSSRRRRHSALASIASGISIASSRITGPTAS